MEDVLQYVIQGIPVGCVYALLAVGLVLTYKTSGVFNLAFGAQAFLSAAIFYDVRERRAWPLWAAFLVAVVVVGPLVGLILDRALFRYMRTAPWTVKLVSALGLLVALPEAVRIWFGTKPEFNPPSIAALIGIEDGRVFRFGDFNINAIEMTTVVFTFAIVVALGVLFRYSSIGLQMRAVVESPRMVELAGVDSERVSMVAWMLSSFLAALAGVLLAPLFAQIDGNVFTILIVAAIAAAAFGRLSSIPLTLVGGLVLGIAQQVLGAELPPDSILARGIRPSLPFAMLFLLLILLPSLRSRREISDPLAGVDPPPPPPAESVKDEAMRRFTKTAFPIFTASFIAVVVFLLPGIWVRRFTDAFVLAIILLSITVFTGLSGQVSLGQTAFAGIGAFTAGALATEQGLPIILAAIVGAALAAVVGMLLAVPALRLGGIFLTLATLAFALMVETVVFPLESVSGGQEGVVVPRPDLFTTDTGFFLFTMAVFAITAMVVILVRNGTTGRFLNAMRGSETAAAAIGINPTREKIVIFGLSAAIAGVGGAMQGMLNGRTTVLDWPALLGVAWVVLVVSLGTRTVQGAVNAALGFVLVQWLLNDALRLPVGLAFIAFGIGAITYAKHPDGVVEWRTRASIEDQVRNRRTNRLAAAVAARGGSLRGYHRVPVQVLLTLVTLGLYQLWWVARTYSEVRRARGGRGVGAPLGFVLNLLGVVVTLFLLPTQVARMYREHADEPLITWRVGRAPLGFILAGAYLAYRYYSLPAAQAPTQIGIFFATLFGVIVFLNWLGQVQMAVNHFVVARAAEELGVDLEPEPEPEALAVAAPVAGAAGA